MARAGHAACGMLIGLLLLPEAVDAAILRVMPDPGRKATGYFLISQAGLDILERNPATLYQKLANTRTFGPHPISDAPYLSAGTYYIYPECSQRLWLNGRLRISENEGRVPLRCQ